jgi:hypothetical protein
MELELFNLVDIAKNDIIKIIGNTETNKIVLYNISMVLKKRGLEREVGHVSPTFLADYSRSFIDPRKYFFCVYTNVCNGISLGIVFIFYGNK